MLIRRPYHLYFFLFLYLSILFSFYSILSPFSHTLSALLSSFELGIGTGTL
jgi:hypothetical protein